MGEPNKEIIFYCQFPFICIRDWLHLQKTQHMVWSIVVTVHLHQSNTIKLIQKKMQKNHYWASDRLRIDIQIEYSFAAQFIISEKTSSLKDQLVSKTWKNSIS